ALLSPGKAVEGRRIQGADASFKGWCGQLNLRVARRPMKPKIDTFSRAFYRLSAKTKALPRMRIRGFLLPQRGLVQNRQRGKKHPVQRFKNEPSNRLYGEHNSSRRPMGR
ncbi:MAG TPA: hypothetical protein VIV82_12755, partial [Verrucomicrobiae bacterium]